jgi:hypothetical protein
MERKPNNDNLHRIAISNLSMTERKIERWWERKFRSPLKAYEDHTYEELLVCMLEDYYERHPEEAERFMSTGSYEVEEWDGKVSDEYEETVQRSFKKFFEKNKVDLTKHQATEEENEKFTEEDVMAQLRRMVPTVGHPKSKESNLEFDEDFEV